MTRNIEKIVQILVVVPMLAFGQAKYKVIGTNDLGMHCMDGKDYSIYSILPPYNTFHAQVVDPTGKLVRSNTAVRLTYTAAPDPTGSINRTSIGKTNFWDYTKWFFGVTLKPDAGLMGFAMPGAGNKPQAMRFDAPYNWFTAEGMPITPYDDAGKRNYYPLTYIIARDTAGKELGRTRIVTPVSDELDCRGCHASGSANTARPNAGWAFLPDPERDYKMNVLRLHDERNAGSPVYQSALVKLGLDVKGLEATVASRPLLCASCHSSNALPGTGFAGITPMTQATHKRHAQVLDPKTNVILDAVNNRTACYTCHPGSETKCLRGAMGNAVDANGNMLMQCQSCHGVMSQVAAANRKGWLEEPSCQNCHTGTALKNNGQIRYTSAFDNKRCLLRLAADTTFATNPNVPAAGLDLYRFSFGHGGLECESCHGSTHAEYPSSHLNDNLQTIRLQGHAGVLSECTACHPSVPSSTTGGPHGLHPIGQSWVSAHGDRAEGGRAGQCRTCHGMDYRGTVLSRAQMSRSFRVEDSTKTFAKGAVIGCYSCHNGPNGG